MNKEIDYKVFDWLYTQSWKSLEMRKKLKLKRCSNYALASFIYFISNNVYNIVSKKNEDFRETYKREELILEDAKNEFINRIKPTLSNLLDERKELNLQEINLSELSSLIKNNLEYVLEMFLWSDFHMVEPEKWQYFKQEFFVPWLWKINFRKEIRNPWKSKDAYIPMELKKAFLNSFIEEFFRGLLIPSWKRKDRIPSILENLNKIKNREISKQDIENYKKIVNFCIKKSWINFRNYEREDYLQDWLLVISKALKKFEWKWFSTLENYLYIVVWNYFKDLKKYHFARKRMWDEIRTFRMWDSDNLFIDEFSFEVWKLLWSREAWDDIWYVSPVALYPIMTKELKKIDAIFTENIWNPLVSTYYEPDKEIEVPF